MLGFVLDFVNLYFLFVNCIFFLWIDETYVEFLISVFCDEINNDLFNGFILYFFINFIAEL